MPFGFGFGFPLGNTPRNGGGVPAPTPTPAITSDVLLVEGQSNSVGPGTTSANAPSGLSTVPSRVKAYNFSTGTVEPYNLAANAYTHPLEPTAPSAWGVHGPYVLKWLSDPANDGKELVVINAGVGGTSLQAGARNSAALPQYRGCWDPSLPTSDPADSGSNANVNLSLYAKSALDRLRIAGSGVTLGTMHYLWAQGESDSISPAFATTYEAALDAKLTWNEANLFTGFAQVRRRMAQIRDVATWPHAAAPRAAFVRLGKKYGYTVAPVNDLSLQGDNAHYSVASYITLGNRLWDGLEYTASDAFGRAGVTPVVGGLGATPVGNRPWIGSAAGIAGSRARFADGSSFSQALIGLGTGNMDAMLTIDLSANAPATLMLCVNDAGEGFYLTTSGLLSWYTSAGGTESLANFAALAAGTHRLRLWRIGSQMGAYVNGAAIFEGAHSKSVPAANTRAGFRDEGSTGARYSAFMAASPSNSGPVTYQGAGVTYQTETVTYG